MAPLYSFIIISQSALNTINNYPLNISQGATQLTDSPSIPRGLRKTARAELRRTGYVITQVQLPHDLLDLAAARRPHKHLAGYIRGRRIRGQRSFETRHLSAVVALESASCYFWSARGSQVIFLEKFSRRKRALFPPGRLKFRTTPCLFQEASEHVSTLTK